MITPDVMAGDSEAEGSAPEAVIPLDNQGALDTIMAAFTPSLARAIGARAMNAPANSDIVYPAIPQPSLSAPGVDETSERASEDSLGDQSLMSGIVSGLMSHLGELSSSSKDGTGAGPSLLAPSTMSVARSAVASSTPTIAAPPSAVFPPTTTDLDDRMARFAEHTQSLLTLLAEGGGVHLHMPNLKGIISPESIKKVFKQAGRMVQNRQLTLNASNSLRVTRRSQ
jgi:hypothetical protein